MSFNFKSLVYFLKDAFFLKKKRNMPENMTEHTRVCHTYLRKAKYTKGTLRLKCITCK